MKQRNIDELRWIRVFTPSHIPPKYIDQVPHRNYAVADFYRFQEGLCLRSTPEGPTLNPLSHLYVLANEENETKGFLWFTVDPLTKDIAIQTYSVDNQYWGKGQAVEKVSTLLKEIRKKANLNKIYWITNIPKHSIRYGFKPSKSVLMEYSEEHDGTDINGRSEPDGKCEHVDAGAAAVPE